MALVTPARPLASLAALFILWKGFLLLVALGAAAASTGSDFGSDSGYDSSTALFFDRIFAGNVVARTLATRLTRWDALYFVRQARDGYVFEQDWAFAAGLPTLVRALVLAFAPTLASGAGWEPLVAILLAHAFHFIAVLALHRLVVAICGGDARLALVAAALHVVSPAGLFLSAPYAESPFAALSFIGSLLFALGIRHKREGAKRCAAIVSAGVVFGLATACRSNGLSNGLLFAVGALRCLMAFVRKPNVASLLAMVAPIVGGLCVAAGSVIPQVVAWRRLCRDVPAGLEPRPWCSRTLPSIYSFVQSEYWNVGFLRYWTLNQLPLFLLASPMLAILISSGLSILRDPISSVVGVFLKSNPREDYRTFARVSAAGQALVALLAVTNYHVQVITRLSSGYPLWYIWVAALLMDARRQHQGRAIAVFMAMYAGVQGALFASFLPPA